MHIQEILNTIKLLFPEVVIQNFEHITKGYENDILVVNNSLIFRVAKNVNRTYEKEILFLDFLQSRINISIPQISFRSQDLKIMGYKIIPWEELTKSVLGDFSERERDIFARQIAEFLFIIHGVSFLPEVKKFNFPHYHKIQHVWERLTSFLREENNPKILAFAESLRDGWNNYSETIDDIRLLHNDLFFKNIICNSSEKKLSGIIDFSDTFYGDYILDFVALYFEDSSFTEKVMDAYESFTHRKIHRENVRLFARTFALNELYFSDTYNKAIASRLIGV